MLNSNCRGVTAATETHLTPGLFFLLLRKYCWKNQGKVGAQREKVNTEKQFKNCVAGIVVPPRLMMHVRFN
jgi:hypothetical protein